MATTANTTNNASAKPNEWDQKELGCMWRRVKQSNQEKYLTGTLNLKNIPGFPDKDIPIVVFSNKRKLKDTHPDLRVYLSERKPAAPAAGNATSAKAPTVTAPAAPVPSDPLL